MPELHVVMYHYVRDLPRTRFPRIHGLLPDEFRAQIDELSSHFEMATLESALDFLAGDYHPTRDLCILTFDDGLKEHVTNVMPLLAERGIQGLFGVITNCIEDHRVAPVHMNHFLTAMLDFKEYRSAFEREINGFEPGLIQRTRIDSAAARRSYPLDTAEMASFKLLLNFLLPSHIRDTAIQRVFDHYCGPEKEFADELYMSWSEVRQLQRAGMLIAGHTHWHRPLSTLNDLELAYDIGVSRALMDMHLEPQHQWPFSYPYGKRNSYSDKVVGKLREAGYHCAFGTERGHNHVDTPLFDLYRTDCKNVLHEVCVH